MSDPDFIPDPAPQPQASQGDFVPDEPDTSAMKDHVEANMKEAVAKEKEKQANSEASGERPIEVPPPHPANGLIEALDAGWQGSFGGLAARGKMPDTVLPEDAPLAMTIASQVSAFAGDLPAIALGLVGGGVAGTVAGSEVPVIGNVTVGALGAGTGAFAVPAAMRKILIDHYQKGDIVDAKDFAARAVATSWEAIKGGVTGAATTLTGGTIGPVAGTITGKVAEVAAMTTVAKGLEGHLPNWKDFAAGAVFLAGVHTLGAGVNSVESKMADVYKQSGVKPADLVEQTLQDPALKQEVLSDNIEGKHIEVPSQEEQLEKGLKPFTEKDLINQNEENREANAEKEPESKPEEEKSEYDKARERIRATIGEKAKVKGSVTDTANQLYNDTIDYVHNVKVAQDRVGRPLTASENAYQLSRTFAVFNDKLNNVFTNGTLDFKTQRTNGPAFFDLIDEIKKFSGGSTKEFEEYAMAKTAIEREGRGIKTPISLEDAKTVVDNAPKEFENFQERRIEIKNKVMQYAKDSGLISAKQMSDMQNANQQHIALHRVIEPDEMTGKTGASSKPYQRAYGNDELKILSPLASDFKDISMVMRASDLNQIKNAAVEALTSKTEDGVAFLRKKAPNMSVINVSADEVTKGLEAQGIDMTGSNLQEGMNVFRMRTMKAGPGEISRFVDGKLEVYEGNQGVIDSLKHVEGSAAGTNLLTTMLRPFAAMTRFGTVTDLGFALRHTYRAQMFAALTSKTGMIPFVHPVLAMGEFFKNSQTYQDFVNLGGAQRIVDTIDDKYISKKIADLNEETPFIQKQWNSLTTGLKMMHAMVAFGDNMTKFAEYRRKPGIADGTATLDQRRQAAFDAREITPDLSRMGAKMEVLKSVAFMNPEIQGKDLAIRTFKEDPLGSTAKSLALYTVPALLAWYSSHDDPRYKALPHWERDLSLNLFSDNWRQADVTEFNQYEDGLKRINKDGTMEVNDGHTFKIPQTFDVGLVFGSMPMRILDAMYDKDPTAMRDFMVDLKNRIPAVPMPNAITPALEQMTNYNFFTGTPLVRDSRKPYLPEVEYNEYTSETAKALGKMIEAVPGLSDIGPEDRTLSNPAILDNYIRTWGGPMGQYAVALIDKALIKSGVQPDPEKPASTIEDWPFVKEFMSRYPSAKAQQIQDFFERNKKSEAVENSIKMLVDRGDVMGAQALRQKYADVSPALKGLEEGIKKQMSTASGIYKKSGIDPIQKRQLIDGLYRGMIQAAVQGNKMLDDLEKQRNNTAKGQ